MGLDLHEAEFLFHSEALDGSQLLVHQFSGRESLSQPFEFLIDLVSKDANLDLDAPIGEADIQIKKTGFFLDRSFVPHLSRVQTPKLELCATKCLITNRWVEPMISSTASKVPRDLQSNILRRLWIMLITSNTTVRACNFFASFVVVSCLLSCSTQEPKRSTSMRFEISLKIIKQMPKLAVLVSIKNIDSKVFYIEKMNAPMGEGVSKRIFEITDNTGAKVQYVGPRPKLAGSGVDDYMPIEPRSKVEFTRRIDDVFKLDPGKAPFKIRYSVINVHRDEERVDEIQSDWLSFDL